MLSTKTQHSALSTQHFFSTPMQDDPEIVEKVLTLLRQWGWETGCQKLEEELRDTDSGKGRLARDSFLGWMAAEQGDFAQALAHFQALAQVPALAGWALAAQAFVAVRQKDFRQAHQWLDEAARRGGADDMLRATVAHLRGTVLHHEGHSEAARVLLLDVLKVIGKDHFGTGRVLDALGMIYAGTDNFHAAQEFFRRALQCKERHRDEAGLALSHGQLGRLYLDWGLWDKAEQHFQEDLQIAQRIGDEPGRAQMYNFLGRVALARGEGEAAGGRGASARRHWETAAGWLDAGIRLSQDRDWTVLEAYARKDRALVYLAEDNLKEAEGQLQRAEELFRARQFAEGLAHVHRAWGILRRRQGRFHDALAPLRLALRHFVESAEAVEAARTQWEIARTHRAAGEPRPLVSQAVAAALGQAEACRRAELIRQIEEELQVVDPEAHCRHVYQRVRGRAVGEDTTSLISGSRETATVLFLDLKDSTGFAREHDPEEVMMTLNQLMADLVGVLRRHDAQVSVFRGDGFLALLRGADHAVRAVTAGLDLFQALAEFNEPRDVLGLAQFIARVGIASGEVFLGNVGTYDKMDFTAIGTTANLGARLEAEARPGQPGISRGTYELVRERFRFGGEGPRVVHLKGLGDHEMWDVIGRKEAN